MKINRRQRGASFNFDSLKNDDRLTHKCRQDLSSRRQRQIGPQERHELRSPSLRPNPSPNPQSQAQRPAKGKYKIFAYYLYLRFIRREANTRICQPIRLRLRFRLRLGLPKNTAARLRVLPAMEICH